MLVGYTCQNSQCVCEQRELPSDTLFPQTSPCSQLRNYGETCHSDHDCFHSLPRDNLICANTEPKTCRCNRGRIWDVVSKRCYLIDDENPFIRDKFDPTRDVIIPSVILMTLGATAWLCFKLFCNCGKSWRRRRRANEVSRAIEEAQIPSVGPSQIIASYRVFGPVNSVDSRSTFPPCILLPAGPPPYEEALKHKVILSSYYPPPINNTPHVGHAQL
ncbi:hypothetical protein O3M35_012917 [Rhynocoris fuscipes]|uniref:Uncharacterized protein n=1 Tax=Rhynocoris fuscipes TaxID=488301 RepID=A0AAW1CHL7_9HEMI